MKYLLPLALMLPVLIVFPPAIAATADTQQHLQSLHQQDMDTKVRSGGQTGVKRLKQKKQDALSFPLLEEMAATVRHGKHQMRPDERGLWDLLHRGETKELHAEIGRLRKLYPGWTPPALLVQASETGKIDKNKNYDLALEQYKAGKLTAALTLLQDDDAPHARGLRGSILFDQGLAEYRTGNFSNASKLWQQAVENGHDGHDVQLMQAWTDLQLGDSPAALKRFATLYQAQPAADVAQGLYQAAHASGKQEQLSLWMSADPDDPLRSLVQSQHSEFLKQQGWIWAARSKGPDTTSELDGIQGPWLDVAAASRSKTGDSGQSRLRIDMLPSIETMYANGNEVWQLRLTHLLLNSGDLPAGARFGSYNPTSSYVAQPTTQTSGWEPTLRWRHEGDGSAYQISLGTTPTSAPVGPTPTFEMMSENISEQGARHVAIYRSSVRDSVLSTTGAVDPYSGQAWGRVVRNGLRTDAYQTVSGPWSVNGNIRAERIDGKGVATNARVAGGLGLGYELGWKDFTYFSVGPSIDYDHYTNNLSHFTWGHGGYFSPQSFLNAGLVARFLTEEGGRFVAHGQVSAGWQRVIEDAASCFPLAPAIAQPSCGDYASSNKQGMSGSIEFLWRYAITPRWSWGGALSLRSSQNYNDTSALLTLRYNWKERHGLYRSDLPEGMFSELF